MKSEAEYTAGMTKCEEPTLVNIDSTCPACFAKFIHSVILRFIYEGLLVTEGVAFRTREQIQGCNPGGINGLGRTNRETYLLMQYCVVCNIKRGVASVSR